MKTQTIQELVTKNRSYRRFFQTYPISVELLTDLVNLARLSPNGANLQPLFYIISNQNELNAKIFNTLGWAAYLKNWKGPELGERPAAYIVMLRDNTIKKVTDCDDGIAAQSILLGAVEQEYGGCIIANIKRKKLRDLLEIDEQFDIKLVIALGKPKEEVFLEVLNSNQDTNAHLTDCRYWRDENQGHHVPKRRLEDIILKKIM